MERIRRLGLAATLAVVLTLAALVVPNDGWPHRYVPGAPVQAHAAGGACGNWWDDPGTVYVDSDIFASGGSFYDAWQSKWTYMRAEFKVWRYTTTGNDGWPAGQCLSSAYAAGWVNDGSYGTDRLSYDFVVGCSAIQYGDTGWNWEGSNSKYNNGWWNVSGQGLIRGYSLYTGHNANWNYWPDNVPAAVVDTRTC